MTETEKQTLGILLLLLSAGVSLLTCGGVWSLTPTGEGYAFIAIGAGIITAPVTVYVVGVALNVVEALKKLGKKEDRS